MAAFACGYVGLRGARDLPTMEDCLTGDLIPFLHDCTVFEVCEPTTVRYRFCGSGVAERLGQEVTGRNMLAFLPEPMRDTMFADMKAMMAYPCGNYARYHNRYSNGNGVETESLSLPICSEADPARTYILAMHLVQKKLVDIPQTGETQIGVEWQQSDFIDLGRGVPVQQTALPTPRLNRYGR